MNPYKVTLFVVSLLAIVGGFLLLGLQPLMAPTLIGVGAIAFLLWLSVCALSWAPTEGAPWWKTVGEEWSRGVNNR